MKTIRISIILTLLIFLIIPSRLSKAQAEWVNINGTITYEGTPLCAIVLANGQYMFTCNDDLGLWDLEVPLDENSEITLYGFCSGFSPFKAILTPAQAQDFDINMTRASAGSREMEILFHTEPGTTNPNWVRISGTVKYGGTPLCAMVLANGQNMFSCGNDLGLFDLEVPLDGNGEITLYVFCSGFAQYKIVTRGDLPGTYTLTGFTVTFDYGLVVTQDDFTSYSGTMEITSEGDMSQTIELNGLEFTGEATILSIETDTLLVFSGGCTYDLWYEFDGNILTTTFPLGTCGSNSEEVDVWEKTASASASSKKDSLVVSPKVDDIGQVTAGGAIGKAYEDLP